jgi:hypothetical protein
MLRQQWLALPRLVRFMLRHFANGVALGAACGLIVIWFDIGGVGSLLASFDSPLLTAFFFAKGGLLFGALAMGVAVMNLGEDEG